LKNHFISFGSPKYYPTLKRIGEEAKKSNFFDRIDLVRYKDLPIQYRFQNIFRLRESVRGFGYWMWKSYLVYEKLKSIEHGDILTYCDSASKIDPSGKKRFNEYIDIVNSSSGILRFELDHIEKQYTKRGVFDFFNLGLESDIANSKQLMATIFIVRKCSYTMDLIQEYYELCHYNYYLLKDPYFKNQEHSEFISHRHDQSLFSILSKLRNCEILPDETWKENMNELINIPFHSARIRRVKK
jgi:hypothetical protein